MTEDINANKESRYLKSRIKIKMVKPGLNVVRKLYNIPKITSF
jgi:hypothetical protein